MYGLEREKYHELKVARSMGLYEEHTGSWKNYDSGSLSPVSLFSE
ncbi:hypothetical protein [Methanosarcina sp.]|nr:hypothetical protein [Methanosarcina sp.]MDY9925273.1 hypothetical protein [Methanosarcina sp.]